MTSRITVGIAQALLLVALSAPAFAFPSLYVAKEEAAPLTANTKIVIARDGDRTTITLSSDPVGGTGDFAMVLAIPSAPAREDIKVVDPAVLDHLEAYTAPRLIEMHDFYPCSPLVHLGGFDFISERIKHGRSGPPRRRVQGVTAEAWYGAGDYDVSVLKGPQTAGLAAWLSENGYEVPAEAGPVIADHLAEGMAFVIVEVSDSARPGTPGRFLPPLQFAFTSGTFTLPIRLGMANARGAQELQLFTLTRGGRTEAVSYPNLPIPSDMRLPPQVETAAAAIYGALFQQAAAGENGPAAFLEHAWDAAWCDPCTSDPPSAAQLRQLGADWATDLGDGQVALAREVFVTRLRLRYDPGHFPDDLKLRETTDARHFQARYVLRHAWQASADCPSAARYEKRLRARQNAEAEALARLTGWTIEDVQRWTRRNGQFPEPPAFK